MKKNLLKYSSLKKFRITVPLFQDIQLILTFRAFIDGASTDGSIYKFLMVPGR